MCEVSQIANSSTRAHCGEVVDACTLSSHEAKAEQSELGVRQRTVVWREQVFVIEISHYGLGPSVQQLPRVLAVLRYVLHTQERSNPCKYWSRDRRFRARNGKAMGT